MFPLGTPLVPHAAIPLHVFEERYRTLTAECLAGDREFGIVMIERGSEVGGGDQRTDIGTLTRIAEAHELEDGRWILLVVGIGRIRVIEWLQDDPYPLALVEEISETMALLGDQQRNDLQARVRRIAALLTELGEDGVPIGLELADDPVAAGYQAMAVAPVGPLDVQTVLAIDDPADRHLRIVEYLADAESLLRMQMGV